MLEVVDDGRGLAKGHGAGHGLSGMRERAEAVGGTFVAGAATSEGDAPAGGFRVSARLPLQGKAPTPAAGGHGREAR